MNESNYLPIELRIWANFMTEPKNFVVHDDEYCKIDIVRGSYGNSFYVRVDEDDETGIACWGIEEAIVEAEELRLNFLEENCQWSRSMTNRDNKDIQNLADNLILFVKMVESGIEATKGHYGTYMGIIQEVAQKDKAIARNLCKVLKICGANTFGVESAFRILYGEEL